MSNPTTTAAVRRAGQLLKDRDGLVATTRRMAEAGRHEDALVSTHDLALLASDALHLLDGLHTRAAEKHRRAALELLDEASAIREAVEQATTREQGVEAAPADDCGCGCTPCRCDETFAECDNPEVEHPGHPCNHYTGGVPETAPVAQEASEARDDVAAGATSVAWANADASSLGTFADGRAALVQKLSGGVWAWHLYGLNGQVIESHRAASRGAAKKAAEEAHTPTPVPEAPSAAPVAPEANEGAGRPAPARDYVVQSQEGATWEDRVTVQTGEADARELLAVFERTWPGQAHRVVSRPRVVEYAVVDLARLQDAAEEQVRAWLDAVNDHYTDVVCTSAPYRRQVGPLEVTLTADPGSGLWGLEVLSEQGRAERLVRTLGDAKVWLYDLLVDEPGERDEDPVEDEEGEVFEVQGLYGAKWETETHASTRAEADSLLADYRRCAPGRPYRVLVRYPLHDGPWM